MALAAKRRRLSQADPPGLSTQPLPEDAGKEEEPEGKPPPVKKRRGRPPKVQRVWSPSGGQYSGITGQRSYYLLMRK